MILSIGSINIDHVYQVDRLPQAGETVAASGYARFLGGKGVNQSVAAARAGADVRHIGAIGPDGDWAMVQMVNAGLNVDRVAQADAPTGHAVINVDAEGENQIVILGGANQALTEYMIETAFADAHGSRTWVILQNETNLVEHAVDIAKSHGASVAYSAAPFDAAAALPLLPKIDILCVNETEAADLANAAKTSIDKLPVKALLMTLGAKGAELHLGGKVYKQPAFAVTPVDTTGAGDTFAGSFVAEYAATNDAAAALQYAAAASAVQVTRQGASTAIPHRDEVLKFIESQT